MKLEKIEIRGFKTFSNATLNVASLSPGLHFIKGENLCETTLGSNGSGKSSLFDSLLWALFGKTVGGLRNNDVRPWTPSKPNGKTEVTVHLDGTTVCRSVSPNRTTIDGKDAGPEQIEKLLGLGFDLASHTILMGQGRPLFFDLPPAQKMSLLSEALGLERWEERSKLAGERHDAMAEHLENLNREVHSQTNLDAELWQILQATQNKAKEWDEQEKVDLEKVELELVGLSELLEKAKNQYAKHDLAYDGAQVELRSLAPQIRKLNQAISQAKAEAVQVSRLKEELKALDDARTCPTCGQPVTKKNLASHRGELAQRLKDAPTPNVGALGAQLEGLLLNEDRFREKSNRAMDDRTHAKDAVSELSANVAGLKKTLGEKREELNPFQEQLVSLKQRRSAIVKDLERLEKEVVSLKTKMELVRFWVKGFREVRLFILEEVLQDMQLVANSTLQEIGLVGWEVSYEVERETKSGTMSRGLNVWIKSPTNDTPVRWECWSGGESQRLKIIGAAALNDVLLSHMGVKTNIEVWDEPTMFLSEGGVEDLVEFLANRAQEQEKVIFFVDHVARESASFASTITVTKKDGVSTIS